jgi:hypothetical protein
MTGMLPQYEGELEPELMDEVEVRMWAQIEKAPTFFKCQRE